MAEQRPKSSTPGAIKAGSRTKPRNAAAIAEPTRAKITAGRRPSPSATDPAAGPPPRAPPPGRGSGNAASCAPAPLEPRAEPLDGAPRSLVALVCLERHAEAPPGLERVPEHEKLGLRVHRRPVRALREPGVADLRRVEHVLAGARIARPLPA